MKVIVDTCIWSLVLRNSVQNTRFDRLLQDLITDQRVVILGAIRQEILSGVRHQEQFEKLKNQLRNYPNIVMEMEDFELAAQYYNLCRRQGIQGSGVDFLICAASVRRKFEILTLDKDFSLYAHHLPIKLLADMVN